MGAGGTTNDGEERRGRRSAERLLSRTDSGLWSERRIALYR